MVIVDGKQMLQKDAAVLIEEPYTTFGGRISAARKLGKTQIVAHGHTIIIETNKKGDDNA
jgi:predicted DNA-binding protein (UPF0251 family)